MTFMTNAGQHLTGSRNGGILNAVTMNTNNPMRDWMQAIPVSGVETKSP